MKAYQEVPGPLDTPCWIWTGREVSHRNSAPYRVIWEFLTNTRIPDKDLDFHHRCQNNYCIRPDHLDGPMTKSNHMILEHSLGLRPEHTPESRAKTSESLRRAYSEGRHRRVGIKKRDQKGRIA